MVHDNHKLYHSLIIFDFLIVKEKKAFHRLFCIDKLKHNKMMSLICPVADEF